MNMIPKIIRQDERVTDEGIDSQRICYAVLKALPEHRANKTSWDFCADRCATREDWEETFAPYFNAVGFHEWYHGPGLSFSRLAAWYKPRKGNKPARVILTMTVGLDI